MNQPLLFQPQQLLLCESLVSINSFIYLFGEGGISFAFTQEEWLRPSSSLTELKCDRDINSKQ